jgi:hypothetical protein
MHDTRYALESRIRAKHDAAIDAHVQYVRSHDVKHDVKHDVDDVRAYNNLYQNQKLWKALNVELKNRKICNDYRIRHDYFPLNDIILWFANIAKYADEPLVVTHNAMKHNLHVATSMLMYEALQYQRRIVQINYPREYARAVEYHATEPCSEYFIPKPEFPDYPIANMTLFNIKTFAEKMEALKQAGVDRLQKHYHIALDFLEQCREAFLQTYFESGEYQMEIMTYRMSDQYKIDKWNRRHGYDEC